MTFKKLRALNETHLLTTTGTEEQYFDECDRKHISATAEENVNWAVNNNKKLTKLLKLRFILWNVKEKESS